MTLLAHSLCSAGLAFLTAACALLMDDEDDE